MLTSYRIPSTSTAPSAVAWIDLRDPTPDEVARVVAEFAVQVPSRAALQEIETSSRIRAEGRTLFASMPLALRDATAGYAAVPLGFVLSPDLLLTIRYSDLHALEAVEERVRAGTHSCSAAIFVDLLEGLVDFAADTLEKLGADLAAVSAQAFANRVAGRRHKRVESGLRQRLDEIGNAGDHLSRIRESLLGLQRITGFVVDAASEWLPTDLRSRMQTIRQDLNSLVDYEGHLFAKTQFLLDAILGFISTEQNETFKVLTIVSVVGIPPTLVASMYGMNFHDMPELAWRFGYPFGLTLIALSTLVPIVWFKRRGWW